MKKLNQETMSRIMVASKKAREKEIKVKLNLSHYNLSGLDLSYADLSGANLRDADLSRTNLSRTNLKNANLEGANLERANLERANLECSNLKYSNLQGANLNHSNLEGANLDFSVFNLSCKSRKIKADSRLINQLLWHVADIMRASGEEIPDAIKERANQSHLISKHGLPEFN